MSPCSQEHLGTAARTHIAALLARSGGPVVEISDPAIHVRRCDALRLLDECSERASLVPAGLQSATASL